MPGPESDVDLLVVASRDSYEDHGRVSELVWDAADAEGEEQLSFSTVLYTPEWLANRREIRAFFIQEVDRDKIVLYGEA